MTTAPSVFFAHGSPMSALGGDAHAAALHAFGDAHRDAAGIVVVSAHWQKAMPINVTSWESAPLIYDFGGFPEELNRIKYPAQGDAALAARIDLQLHAAGLSAILDPGRGLDHGAWVPLLLAWPDASIPVVQVSLPTVTPRALFALGDALRPLREDGVIVAASGGIVHNLRRLDIRNKDAAVEPWATEFDEWVAKKIETRNLEDLFRYHTKAPNASRAVPTSEHFDPIFVTLGAAAPEEKPQTIYTGFHYGTISMRSFAFGA